jgi:hypothetical protein
VKYTLRHPVEFNGSTYTYLMLPDEAKVRHEIVGIRIGKVLADFKKEKFSSEDFAEDDFLGLPGEALVRFKEVERLCERLLIEAYCEDFPPDAIDELTISDKDALVRVIRKLQNTNVMPEKAGVEAGKKSSPRRHSA